jgi:hypothetical protein
MLAQFTFVELKFEEWRRLPMKSEGVSQIQRPRTDDRPLWDVVFGLYGYPAVLLAHKFKLFPLLEKKPLTVLEVCEALELKRRPAEAILTTAVSLGFLNLRDGRYGLTPVSEEYLLPQSPTYFGTYWDLNIDNYSVCSLDNLEKAVRTDTAQAYGAVQEMFKSHGEKFDLARFFTRAMHGTSMAPALAWPEVIGLSDRKCMLDIGGGSGAHSIGAVLKWPGLGAIVLDNAPVCEVAAEYIEARGLKERVRTQVGDMWKDAFPPADIHFYSFIYHDWTPEKCRFLTKKSFDSLPSGGQILIHEMLYNDEKTGPFPIAAFTMIMMGWTEGEQYSGPELSSILGEAGFTNIEIRPTVGYWSIVSARKP